MKKTISLLLALVLCLSLCACGGTNIEKFCAGSSICWDGYEGQHNDTVTYYALFENGILTIEKRTPKASSSSPTGKIWTVAESNQYRYELQGSDTVIIEGEAYTYEIIDKRVKFDKDLMGIDNYWKQ